jgi:hypothetical protein
MDKSMIDDADEGMVGEEEKQSLSIIEGDLLVQKSTRTSCQPSSITSVLGEGTNLHEAKVPLISDITGTTFNVTLSDLLKELEKRNGTLDGGQDMDESGPPLPAAVTQTGGIIAAEIERLGKKRKTAQRDKLSLGKKGDLAPVDYNAVLSQPNFFSQKVDFEILKKVITESNLGTIESLVTEDTAKAGFRINFSNKITQFYTVEHNDGKPIQVFSAFFTSFQQGVIAQEMSGGSNCGWGLKKADWISEGFASIIEIVGDEDQIPLLLSTCDLERIYIDQSTSLLLGCFKALPFSRVGLTFGVDKNFGSIHEMTIIGYYERTDFKEYIRGILLLLEDFKNFSEAAADIIKKLDLEMEDEVQKLRDGYSEVEISELYKGLNLDGPPSSDLFEDEKGRREEETRD